jgi:hypothetical protein
MSSLAKAGISHPGMSEIEREYANKKLTLLKLGDNESDGSDGILVPEEVALEMPRRFAIAFNALCCLTSRLFGAVLTCDVLSVILRFDPVGPQRKLQNTNTRKHRSD